MTILVNHVMSSETFSGIFTDLLEYYRLFCDEDIRIITSVKPIDEADIYHYHRPHLESKLRANAVVTVHHDINDSDEWLQYEKFHDRYKESKLVLCLNSTQKNILALKEIYQTEIIPHGYSPTIFNNPQKKKFVNNKINIGIISKRYGRKVKGEAYLFELMKRLDSRRFKFTFVGAERSISAYKAETMGFETHCFERLPYFCFGDLYNQLNFLLVTSLYEGGPANIPEAIASATPIISTPIGMSNDYVKHKHNGLILTGDVDNDCEIIETYSNKKEYLELANASWEMKKEALTWKEVMKLTSTNYKKLVRV